MNVRPATLARDFPAHADLEGLLSLSLPMCCALKHLGVATLMDEKWHVIVVFIL
jgi:hypothetical protein